MKTFLRTTLFWLIAGIAFLLVSGFGNIFNPAFPQHWLVHILPESTMTEIGDYAVNEFQDTLDLNIICPSATDLCPTETADEDSLANIAEIPAIESTTTTIQETTLNTTLHELLQGQALLSQQINEQMKQLSQQMSQQLQQVSLVCQTGEGQQTFIDPAEQKRLELQAQIEALQSEMANI